MNHRWQLTVDESFAIRGRGLVLVGNLVGQATMGDRAVLVTTDGQNRQVAVLGVDHSHSRPHGGMESRVGILIGLTDLPKVPRGAVLHAAM